MRRGLTFAVTLLPPEAVWGDVGWLEKKPARNHEWKLCHAEAICLDVLQRRYYHRLEASLLPRTAAVALPRCHAPVSDRTLRDLSSRLSLFYSAAPPQLVVGSTTDTIVVDFLVLHHPASPSLLLSCDLFLLALHHEEEGSDGECISSRQSRLTQARVLERGIQKHRLRDALHRIDCESWPKDEHSVARSARVVRPIALLVCQG